MATGRPARTQPWGTIMPKYRNRLPQLGEKLFLTDGGMETTLIFHDGLELPSFAAFDLLNSEKGRKALRDYYVRYIEIARDAGAGMILESADLARQRRLGREARLLDGRRWRDANRDAIAHAGGAPRRIRDRARRRSSSAATSARAATATTPAG